MEASLQSLTCTCTADLDVLQARRPALWLWLHLPGQLDRSICARHPAYPCRACGGAYRPSAILEVEGLFEQRLGDRRGDDGVGADVEESKRLEECWGGSRKVGELETCGESTGEGWGSGGVGGWQGRL